MTITKLRDRLTAMWELARGRLPRPRAVELPFHMGFGMLPGAPTTMRGSGTPNQRIPVAQLRKFSESPVPRRLINYLRFSITHLDWTIAPLEGEELKKKHETAIKRLKRFLRAPNPDDTWEAWLGQMVEDMLVAGWGTSEIKPYEAGGEDRPCMFWPVDATSMQVDTAWKGEARKPRYWQVNYLKIGDEPQFTPFLNSELMMWKYVPRSSTPFGLAPMEVAFNEIHYLLDAMAFAGRTASNAQPKKLLWIDGLDPEQLKTIRQWWKDSVDGSGEMPILGAPDTKASTLELGLVTDQNLFLKWQEFLIAVIADAFGIDVAKVNLIVGLNRSTGDKLDDTTDAGAIEPLATMIEQYMDKYVLPLFELDDVAQFKFRFTTSISDIKGLSTVNQVELQDDSMTINEARARMGRGPLLHSITGEDIGKMTLAYYREIVKIPEFRTKGFAGLEEAIERQREAEDQANEAKLGDNSNNTNPDKSQRGGNGVHSAPKPKDKAFNSNDA